MISASEMREIADKSNEELHQKQLSNVEELVVKVVSATEERIRQRAACGEYFALTPDLLYELRAFFGPILPSSSRVINDLLISLSIKLKEHFSGQGFSAYPVAPLDHSACYLKIEWGGDKQ